MKITPDGRFAIRPSLPGVGDGLFAVKKIHKGEFLIEYTGRRIPTPEANRSPSRYLFEIDRSWTIDGPVPENIAGYINHGCEPNCEAIIEEGEDGEKHIMLYALDDIESGQELSFDYGKEYFDEFIKPVGCKCESCMRKKRRH